MGVDQTNRPTQNQGGESGVKAWQLGRSMAASSVLLWLAAFLATANLQQQAQQPTQQQQFNQPPPPQQQQQFNQPPPPQQQQQMNHPPLAICPSRGNPLCILPGAQGRGRKHWDGREEPCDESGPSLCLEGQFGV